MRDFKFRAWASEEIGLPEIMVYFNLFEDAWIVDRKNAIVMQYTELRDKNGKEIYEGDVFCWLLGDGTLNRGLPVVVKWETIDFDFDGGEMTGYHLGKAMSQMIEVIGNIYENPELLDKNK